MGARRTILRAIFSQAAGGADIIAAPGGGLRIYVVSIAMSAPAAATLKFTSGTGPTDLTHAFDFGINGGYVIVADGEEPILETDQPNQKLAVTVTGTGPVKGTVRYYLSGT